MTLTEPPAPQPLTDERLTAIEKRANAATKGPWQPKPELGSLIVHTALSDGTYSALWDAECATEADAEFTAHAREDVPALLDEVKRLRATLALAAVLEIPRPGTGIPLQLRRSYGHADRWAICDREGRRWHREHGWVYESQGIRDEAQRDATRYTLSEAEPLAKRIAAGEVQS